MRLMKSTHPTDIVVPAAHSRVVRPGDVVDFDEMVVPRYGAGYTFESALSEMVEGFSPVEPEEAETAETDAGGDASSVPSTDAGKSKAKGGRKAKGE